MKVGDLVQLSAAGSKNRPNWSMEGKMGIILAVNVARKNPYQVQWLGEDSQYRTKWWMKRHELKMLRSLK
jgi:hypothetical protein